jgi:hypothetical protein
MSQSAGNTIRIPIECGLDAAVRTQALLLEGLRSGKALRVVIEDDSEVDIATLQLLWAARRAAEGRRVGFTVGCPESTAQAMREAGFEPLMQSPGEAEWPK